MLGVSPAVSSRYSGALEIGPRAFASATHSESSRMPFRTFCIFTLASLQRTRIMICSRGISRLNTATVFPFATLA